MHYTFIGRCPFGVRARTGSRRRAPPVRQPVEILLWAIFASLVLALTLLRFAFSARLGQFRRILTLTVTGTIIILTPVTVMPVIFQQMNMVPGGTPAAGGPLSVVTTLTAIVGIVAGSLVSFAFGLYDVGRIADAPWIGLPAAQWPGLDLEFGAAFWSLLPAFLFIAAVCSIQTISGSVAIQRVSWRSPRAVHLRAVQGAVAADSAGNLLSALAGTMPLGNRPQSASLVEITGIASRSIGIAAGAVFVLMACLPKALVVILAIPGPVAATFITISMASNFVTKDSRWHVHHALPKALGGLDKISNLMLPHPNCHRQVHSQGTSDGLSVPLTASLREA